MNHLGGSAVHLVEASGDAANPSVVPDHNSTQTGMANIIW